MGEEEEEDAEAKATQKRKQDFMDELEKLAPRLSGYTVWQIDKFMDDPKIPSKDLQGKKLNGVVRASFLQRQRIIAVSKHRK